MSCLSLTLWSCNFSLVNRTSCVKRRLILPDHPSRNMGGFGTRLLYASVPVDKLHL